MWSVADSGTKGAELGAGLIATAGLGFVLLWIERASASQADRVERVAGLAAAPPPATDDGSDLLQRALVDQTVALAQRAIERGEAPLDNRDTAIELYPDVRPGSNRGA